MGILNRTTDSFFDKGAYFAFDRFLALADQLVHDGADLLDVGGVKAGPGPEVGEAEELDRVVPAIAALRERFDVPLSVDTWRASVAAAAFEVGALVGNDISGFADPGYLDAAAAAGATVVATHIRLAPRVPDPEPHYDDVVAEVGGFLLDRAARAEVAGLSPDQVIVDAGLDLGKTAAQSLELLRHSAELASLGYPLLLTRVEQDLPRQGARPRDRRATRRFARRGGARHRPGLPGAAGARRRRHAQGPRPARRDPRGDAVERGPMTAAKGAEPAIHVVKGADESMVSAGARRAARKAVGAGRGRGARRLGGGGRGRRRRRARDRGAPGAEQGRRALGRPRRRCAVHPPVLRRSAHRRRPRRRAPRRGAVLPARRAARRRLLPERVGAELRRQVPHRRPGEGRQVQGRRDRHLAAGVGSRSQPVARRAAARCARAPRRGRGPAARAPPRRGRRTAAVARGAAHRRVRRGGEDLGGRARALARRGGRRAAVGPDRRAGPGRHPRRRPGGAPPPRRRRPSPSPADGDAAPALRGDAPPRRGGRGERRRGRLARRDGALSHPQGPRAGPTARPRADRPGHLAARRRRPRRCGARSTGPRRS